MWPRVTCLKTCLKVSQLLHEITPKTLIIWFDGQWGLLLYPLMKTYVTSLVEFSTLLELCGEVCTIIQICYYYYHDFRATSPIGWPQPGPQPSTRLAQQQRLRPRMRQVEASWGLAYLAGPYWITSTWGWGKLGAEVQLDLDLHREHITA